MTKEAGKRRRVATTKEEAQRENNARAQIELHQIDNMQDIEQATRLGTSDAGSASQD